MDAETGTDCFICIPTELVEVEAPLELLKPITSNEKIYYYNNKT